MHVVETGAEEGGYLLRWLYTMYLREVLLDKWGGNLPGFFIFSVLDCFVHLLLYLAPYVRSGLRHCAFRFFFLVLFLLRIEYDAYRTDLEELNLGPRDANTLPKIEQSQQLFQVHKEKYDKMRNDVSIKLKFLEENKVSYN